MKSSVKSPIADLSLDGLQNHGLVRGCSQARIAGLAMQQHAILLYQVRHLDRQNQRIVPVPVVVVEGLGRRSDGLPYVGGQLFQLCREISAAVVEPWMVVKRDGRENQC
jgi:hypothetical protein